MYCKKDVKINIAEDKFAVKEQLDTYCQKWKTRQKESCFILSTKAVYVYTIWFLRLILAKK